jgi:putative spermidine/putrescine transport system permease protein
MGEFTMAALLNRPAFGPYLQLVGANKAYEPSALSIIAFAITWLPGPLQLVSRFSARRAGRHLRILLHVVSGSRQSRSPSATCRS